MLSMRRVLKIAAFVTLLTGLFLVYTYTNEKFNISSREQLIVPEAEILSDTGSEHKSEKSGKHKYYLAGVGLAAQNISAYCRDEDFICYDKFKQENITESSDSTVIFACSEPTDYISLERIKELNRKGVNFIFALGVPENPELQEFAGIEKLMGKKPVQSFSFEQGLLPYMEQSMICPDYNVSRELKLSRSAQPLIYEEENGIPLLYEYESGGGNITVFNTTLLDDMGNIGLLTAAMARNEEDFICPVIGNAYLFLDNIPTEDRALRLRGMDSLKFTADKLWPTFSRLSLHYNMPYTVALPMVETDNAKLSMHRQEFILSLSRDVLRTGDELAMGCSIGKAGQMNFRDTLYNQFELRFPRYKFSAAEEVSGMLDKTRKDSLSEKYPELEIFRRNLYDLDGNYNFNSYSDESSHLYVPVYSRGIGENSSWIWDAAMSVSSRGCFSHSLDMNEITDMINDTENWEENLKQLEDFFERGPGKLQWLEGKTISSGRTELIGYEALDYDMYREDSAISLKLRQYIPGQKFYLRTDKKIEGCTGGSFMHINGAYYLLKAEGDELRISFK